MDTLRWSITVRRNILSCRNGFNSCIDGEYYLLLSLFKPYLKIFLLLVYCTVGCGLKRNEGREMNCEAFGKTCLKCLRRNHFASICKSKAKTSIGSSITKLSTEN